MSGQGHVKYNIWENRTHATNVTNVTVQAGDLRRLEETNISENFHDFASFQAGDLRRRLKMIMEKFRTSAIIGYLRGYV